MATSEELLNRIDAAVDALEEAQETVIQATERIGNAIHNTGDETISGTKTFTSLPMIPQRQMEKIPPMPQTRLL